MIMMVIMMMMTMMMPMMMIQITIMIFTSSYSWSPRKPVVQERMESLASCLKQ